MKKKLMMMAATLLFGAGFCYSDTVQGWDLSSNNTNPVPAGWTTWDTGSTGTAVTVGSSSTVGDLTLTYTAGGLTNAVITTSTVTVATAPPLLAANDGVLLDVVATPQDVVNTFTISGLTAGKTYEIQFTGYVPGSSQLTRNIKIVQDGTITGYALTPYPSVPTLFYSPVFTITPAGGVTSTTFDVTRLKAGSNAGLSGVIVKTIGGIAYALTVNNGSGSGSYAEGTQTNITANPAPSGKLFDQWTGDTQYIVSGDVTSTTVTVSMPAQAVTLTASYKDIVLDGPVVAAWDFGDVRIGEVPAGWTTWTSSDMSNLVSTTVGDLTLSLSATQAVISVSQIDALGIWSEQAPALLALDNDLISQNVYEDYLSNMTANRATTLTLSGLTAGKQYQIQFLGVFVPTTNAQTIAVTQDGAAADGITYTAGTTGEYRVAYSHYYNFTATETNTDVQFGFVGPSNAGKNGLAGMIVKQVNPAGFYSLTILGGSGSGSYTNGEIVEIAADAPLYGMTFDAWIGDTQYVDNVTASNTIVTMPDQAVTLTATYKSTAVTLTASAGPNGTVSPASTNVVPGNSAVFVVTASNFFRIASLTTNGTAVTGVTFDSGSTTTNFTWNNVQAAGTLAATFTEQLAADPAGTPYSWLAGYGLTNYDADAVADQDMDGLKTWQEYIAGTDPTNAASTLKVAQTNRNTVTWSPVAGRVYSVYWSTNLVKGFTDLATGITYPQGSYTNTTPDAKVNHYQVRVQLP